jgi:hypothetical protein
MMAKVRSLVVLVGIALAAVLGVEGVLRIAGHPDGRFQFSFVY